MEDTERLEKFIGKTHHQRPPLQGSTVHRYRLPKNTHILTRLSVYIIDHINRPNESGRGAKCMLNELTLHSHMFTYDIN